MSRTYEDAIRDAVSALKDQVAEDPLRPYMHVEDAIAVVESLGEPDGP